MQNFSNPFNSSKPVQIETIHKTFISLKVLNVLGNEIAILINKEKSTGTLALNGMQMVLPVEYTFFHY